MDITMSVTHKNINRYFTFQFKECFQGRSQLFPGGTHIYEWIHQSTPLPTKLLAMDTFLVDWGVCAYIVATPLVLYIVLLYIFTNQQQYGKNIQGQRKQYMWSWHWAYWSSYYMRFWTWPWGGSDIILLEQEYSTFCFEPVCCSRLWGRPCLIWRVVVFLLWSQKSPKY